MPLSEDEQRILRQIEEDLQSDPSFSGRGYRVARGRVALLIVGFLAGIALTVFGLGVGFWLSLAGFIGTFVVALLLEQEIRILGRERIGELPVNAWLTGRAFRNDE